MGITPVMVTGDNWTTARAVAKEVGIYPFLSLWVFKVSVLDNFWCVISWICLVSLEFTSVSGPMLAQREYICRL